MFQSATFSLRHVVKRCIRYERVCPSVCPSHLYVTPNWFKISKHALYYTLEGCFWFLKIKFSHPEFGGWSTKNALKGATTMSRAKIGPYATGVENLCQISDYLNPPVKYRGRMGEMLTVNFTSSAWYTFNGAALNLLGDQSVWVSIK